ncbi:RING-H2 finger protein ATL75 [Hibiscus syriacus]|uniref:RING-type E3 ubiquitin transferase n=1 Tax=Hibiscus syriacus TaxID=106335 RepID=A0A6A2WRI4_HIBSY|nr:RING-H2 finger protein ATL75 [Hibiscus syriacus]
MSSPSTSSQFLQDFLGKFHSRKLLLYYKQLNQSSSHTSAPPPYPQITNIDQNVFMILSVLICGLICSLGLNLIIRCVLRCSNREASEYIDNPSAAIVDRGIEPKALKTFPVVNYSAEMNLPGLDSECVICLSEFLPGEHLRFLPKCNHGFHVRCIDKWLKSHTSCPKCRHCLLETCQKIMGCNQSSSPESTVNIQPLEPEGMVRDSRGVDGEPQVCIEGQIERYSGF